MYDTIIKQNYFDFSKSYLLVPLQTKFAEITISSAAVPSIKKAQSILLAHFHASQQTRDKTIL